MYMSSFPKIKPLITCQISEEHVCMNEVEASGSLRESNPSTNISYPSVEMSESHLHPRVSHERAGSSGEVKLHHALLE